MRLSRLLGVAMVLAVLLAGLNLSGCASMEPAAKQRQVASVLAYLYPGDTNLEALPPAGVAELHVPFRLGLAFVPDAEAKAQFRLPETDLLRLLGVVRDAFRGYPFIRELEVVPSMYLTAGGGFENLDRAAQLLRLDVVALVSYDQVQHADASGWSFLYWTGLGAYVVEGDRYDVFTVVETAVIDVRSHRLLMRASGTSTQKGSATMVSFSERSRAARTTGFDEAMQKMIPSLDAELQAFRARAPRDPGIRLVLPPGYDPRKKE